jgi:hypothetical protein
VDRLPDPLQFVGVPPAIPYQIGAEIRFDCTGNSRAWMLNGWSHPEPSGTWTDAGRAELHLPLQEPVLGPIRLSIEAAAYVRPAHPLLEVCVACEDEVIADWSIESPEFAFRTCTVPARGTPRSDLIIEFRIINPVSPAQLGESADARLLGLWLRRARLELPQKHLHLREQLGLIPQNQSQQSTK